MTKDRDKWRKYVDGVAEDGLRTKQNIMLLESCMAYTQYIIHTKTSRHVTEIPWNFQ